jgi:lipoyl(octanoyl) transferase
MSSTLDVQYLGKIGYQDALELQFSLNRKRQEGKIGDTLLLLEHYPVITRGKRGKETDILFSKEALESRGFEVYETNRGGEVTYHGPGQIVGYAIIDIAEHGKDLHLFVRNIEEVFISLLRDEYGLTARRDRDHTGVWVENEKITAIGIAVRKWVSMHGFAFNVNTELDHFETIVPCGIRDKGVTSLAKLTGRSPDIKTVQKQVADYFRRIFGFS